MYYVLLLYYLHVLSCIIYCEHSCIIIIIIIIIIIKYSNYY